MALDIGHRRLKRAVATARRHGRHLPSVVIVGGGLSGLGAAIQLVRSGITDFTIVERSDGVGGTWRDNTYPGSGCDVPTHLYSFSFAPKSDWSRRFAEQPEILTYAEACVQRFGLAPHLRLRTTVRGAAFDEGTARWRLAVGTPDGEVEELVADAVVFACGQLNRPAVPDLAGLESFAGPHWHSARWDHRVDLSGKRVAVVGNGASAVQFVPPVAGVAESLTIYQRSANYVTPKSDRVYGPRQHWLLQHVRAYELAYRWWIYWTLEARWVAFRQDSWAGRKLRAMMTKGIRAGVVSDRLPEAVVVPDYPVGCKRILMSNDWYPAILRSNVETVAVPIDHVDPGAVVTADGRRRPADVLIFGTGFHTTDFLSEIPVTGRGGVSLASVWRHGARAYRGTSVAGFPNLFVLYGPNTNLGHNSILFMVERQLNLVLQALALQADAAGAESSGTVEVTGAAFDREDSRIQRLMAGTVWVSACHSWYKDAAGRVTNNWPTWTVRYWRDTLRLDRRDVTVTLAPDAVPARPSVTSGV
ncbi:MAG: flavin-containing monooxygenase [Acidimicrobiales bacterium]|jgi:cation diffusion facilitator CzcD-associated flavoprotein CzcO